MKRLAFAIALLVPTTAIATQTPVAEIEKIAHAEQAFEITMISHVPQLPIAPPATATACALPLEALPHILSDFSLAGAAPQIAFCIQN